jgi:hypothetical protein
MPSFHELEIRWGAAEAFHYLLETEKAAKIASWKMTSIDPETRLANACRVHDQALSVQHVQAA